LRKRLAREAVRGAAGEALWRALFCPDTLPPPAPPGFELAAQRFATLTSPALAEFLLSPAAERLRLVLFDRNAVRHSRLEARFARAAQIACVDAFAANGIEVVYLKGFANAYTLYPDPDLRLFGDLDVLIQRADLPRVVALFSARGFTFRPGASPRWGFQTDASFVPFASADDACNLDIHVEPDSYPIDRALDAARVFSRARTIMADGRAIRVPAPEHAVVLAFSNAAKDKLGPFAVRKLIDLVRLFDAEPHLDWDEILVLLARGQLMLPARATVALLARLGARLPPLPTPLVRPLWSPASSALDDLVAEYRALVGDQPGVIAALIREFTLCAEPMVALRLNLRRFIGLFRPRTGVPVLPLEADRTANTVEKMP
jgi:hypothetical protein